MTEITRPSQRDVLWTPEEDDLLRRLARSGESKSQLAVNKVTWAQVGCVTVPGRYMYRFGWITITVEDLAIWRQLPNAAFTLYRMIESEDEFRLGAFMLPADGASNE